MSVTISPGPTNTIVATVINQSVGPTILSLETISISSQGSVIVSEASTVAPKKFSQSVGNGVLTQFTLNHNLDTVLLLVQVWNTTASPIEVFNPQKIARIDSNTIRVDFSSPPSSNQMLVVILG